LSDPVVSEATRLLEAAGRERLPLRVLGGVAIAILARQSLPKPLQRTYADIDLVVKRNDGPRARTFLVALGYEPDRSFNSLHGSRRLLFYDLTNSRRLDVFVGVFKMCHELDLESRLELVPLTLAPADLLLTKLQIVELNQKDLVDIVSLFYVCGVGDEARPDAIDLSRLAVVTGGDWGWYTTVSDNLARVAPAAAQLLIADDAAVVASRVEAIRQAIERAPKSFAWKLRARVGRRLQWYELPDEVA
jgi:putative nucleotidyltransferase-like protein